ncbi:MAG: tetratricopeptide repeat protein [Oligoflexales bacterium]
MFSKNKKDPLEEANKLIFVKNYTMAESILEKSLASAKYEDSLLMHLRYVELALKLGKLENLQKNYERKLGKHPERLVYRMAKILVDQHGEFITPEEAVAEYSTIIKEFGESPAAYYGIGFSMEILGNLDRALFNYKKSIEMDPTWYPSAFGLSQIYYLKGEDKTGDYYFYMFEKSAPYNVYGNFETHKELFQEFLDEEMYDEAAKAMSSLIEWWEETKGQCPLELRIQETFALSKVCSFRKDVEGEAYHVSLGKSLVEDYLSNETPVDNTLLFIARTLEEYGQVELAAEAYLKIVRNAGTNVDLIQKIGGQFLTTNQDQMAKSLFDEAYLLHPDNPEIRFCRLVANLKVAGIDIESYLVAKEKAKKLSGSAVDPLVTIPEWEKLARIFYEDPDTHAELASNYLKISKIDKAREHFRKMYELDSKSRIAMLKYASFETQLGNIGRAREALSRLSASDFKSYADLSEYYWLKTAFHSHAGEGDESKKNLELALTVEPWNVSFILQQILQLSTLPELRDEDPVIEKLRRNDEDNLDWTRFDLSTERAAEAHAYELAYARQKLRYVYSGDPAQLSKLIPYGKKFNLKTCASDFLKLLNTNFDGPDIYVCLGQVYKEMWQLEAASMWLEAVLGNPLASDRMKATVYLELADCLVWRGVDLGKAREYAKLAIDLGGESQHRAFTVLAHALLKSGQVREAQIYLDHNDREKENDIEVTYLKGLVLYRNGLFTQANKIWKPLITHRIDGLKFYNIKQEIMRYYYEKEPYLKVN